MRKRVVGAGIALAALAVGGGLYAWMGVGSEEPELRDAEAAATLKPDEGSLHGDLIVTNGVVLSLDTVVKGNLLAGFDMTSGKEKWAISDEDIEFAWVGSDFVAVQPSGNKVEIRGLDSGEVRHEIELEPLERAADEPRLVGVAADVVLIVNPDGDGEEILTGVDPVSGKEVWTYRDEFTDVQPMGVRFGVDYEGVENFASGLRLASDAPLFTVSRLDRPAEAVGLEAGTGRDVWKLDLGSVGSVPWPDWDGDDHASAVTDRSDTSGEGTVTTVDLISGEAEQVDVQLAGYDRKKRKWGATEYGHPGLRIADGFAFAQDIDHRPRVIELATGKPVWTAKHPGVPLVFGDGIAVYQRVSEEGAGEVYGVEVETGEVLWTSEWVEGDVGAEIVDGMLLVEEDFVTKAYDVKTGKGEWEFRGSLVGWDRGRFVIANGESGLEVSVVSRDGG